MWSSVYKHNSLNALMLSHFTLKLDYGYFSEGEKNKKGGFELFEKLSAFVKWKSHKDFILVRL